MSKRAQVQDAVPKSKVTMRGLASSQRKAEPTCRVRQLSTQYSGAGSFWKLADGKKAEHAWTSRGAGLYHSRIWSELAGRQLPLWSVPKWGLWCFEPRESQMGPRHTTRPRKGSQFFRENLVRSIALFLVPTSKYQSRPEAQAATRVDGPTLESRV